MASREIDTAIKLFGVLRKFLISLYQQKENIASEECLLQSFFVSEINILFEP